MTDYFKNLTSKEKNIIQDKGTEPPFSGEYNDFYEDGIFVCRACNSALYKSNSKIVDHIYIEKSFTKEYEHEEEKNNIKNNKVIKLIK